MINIFFSLIHRTRHVMGNNPIKVFIFFFALISYSTTGYMFFELPQNPDLRWEDAFWWTIVTMTTVGYGDLFPSSTAGRFLIGLPTMLLGVGLLGYGLSVVATYMIENKLREEKGMEKFHGTDHIVICHFAGIEKTLNLIGEIWRDSSTKGCPIVLIDDQLDENPPALQDAGVHFVKGDASRKPTLEQANIHSARAAIIQAVLEDSEHSDNKNLRVVLTFETMASQIFTVVECLNPDNIPFFKRANCDSVVCINEMSSQLLVQELQDPGVSSVLNELSSNHSDQQFYLLPLHAEYATFGEIKAHFENEHTIILGIRRAGENHFLPDTAFALAPDDLAVVISAHRPS